MVQLRLQQPRVDEEPSGLLLEGPHRGIEDGALEQVHDEPLDLIGRRVAAAARTNIWELGSNDFVVGMRYTLGCQHVHEVHLHLTDVLPSIG